MKDVKVGLIVAVPAAFALIGIIWLLRHQKKRRKPKDDSSSGQAVDATNERGQSKKNTLIEKDGITLTQRKIPENQTAHNSGGLQQFSDSDALKTGIVDIGNVSAKPDSFQVQKSVSGNDGHESSTRLLTSTEGKKVDEIVEEAMDAGLQEATSVLSQNCEDNTANLTQTEVVEEMFSQSSASSTQAIFKEEASSLGSVSNQEIIVDYQSLIDATFTMDSENKNVNSNSEADVHQGNTSVSANFESFASASSPSSVLQSPKDISSPPYSWASMSDESVNKTSDGADDSALSAGMNQETGCSTEEENSTNIHPQTDSSNDFPQSSCVHANQFTSVETSKPIELAMKHKLEEPVVSDDMVSHSTSVLENSPLQMSDKNEQADASSVAESSLDYSTAAQSLDVSEMVQDSNANNLDCSHKESGEVQPKEPSPAKSSSPVCDNNSEGSNDSGRGGSEQDTPCLPTPGGLVTFDFNIPVELCGRLIGRQGKNINHIKSKSGANLTLINNPFTAEFQICQVIGTKGEVDEALSMIRWKFPLQENPKLTMVALNVPSATQPEQPVIVPDVMQMSLPEGVSVDVFVSAIVDSGHVFVQQPTHRSFMSLETLTHILSNVYGGDSSIPSVPTPVECGVICVCENEGSWYRTMIMTPEDEYGECQVKFVDYGGYAQMHVSCLKQIRTDFMSLPFQAVECLMANITPLQDEEYFSQEAALALSEMTQCKVLQCQMVARSEDGTPYIHLYQIDTDTNTAELVNRSLVNRRLVRWVEIL